MLTMLRMNESLMEYMSAEYDNLHSRIEVSETHITKELRDKTEQQARETVTMGDIQTPPHICDHIFFVPEVVNVSMMD